MRRRKAEWSVNMSEHGHQVHGVQEPNSYQAHGPGLTPESAQTCGVTITWHGRCDVFEVNGFYFTCSSGKGPIENAWEEEGFQKKLERSDQMTRPAYGVSHSNWTNHTSSLIVEQSCYSTRLLHMIMLAAV